MKRDSSQNMKILITDNLSSVVQHSRIMKIIFKIVKTSVSVWFF